MDYVLKQRPGRLPAAVRNALRSVEERARLEHMEREMRTMEEQLLRSQRLEILAANARDMEEAVARGLSGALLDRLHLDDGRVEGMARALDDIERVVSGTHGELHRFPGSAVNSIA